MAGRINRLLMYVCNIETPTFLFKEQQQQKQKHLFQMNLVHGWAEVLTEVLPALGIFFFLNPVLFNNDFLFLDDKNHISNFQLFLFIPPFL